MRRIVAALVVLVGALAVLAAAVTTVGLAASHATDVLAPGSPASERLTANT